MASVDLLSLHPFLKKQTTENNSGGIVHSYSHDHGSGVILCMVHGYPQSSYMWRHVVPLWKDKASLFIPELPGYGISSAPPSPSKKEVGAIILEALHASMKDGATRPIIWCSHDRGARVGHRVLAAQIPGSENIKSAVFMDIVPTRECWRGFAHPAASVGYFHWPFLAQPNAPEMIMAMGGDLFCQTIFDKSAGSSEQSKAKLYENNAVEHYKALFAKAETIRGSCADYREGSVQESEEQEEDQKAGRKVKVPVLALYSAGNLGRAHDVTASWRPYVDAEVQGFGIGDGVGHYLPESAPEVVSEHVLAWIEKTAL
ncbi:hypothetical protein AMS68_000288 [Peltaster fructicola]|uniref:AB hydrolase-1 domain-containing protein n=1 Tax=Peltaster fructicola TaxID=286661 RepID=A0A6H0XJF2_9PEZI|nr:hypothetical protein AMS68_000288 [Peltaster fructicola]